MIKSRSSVFKKQKILRTGSALQAIFTSAIVFGKLCSPLAFWNKFNRYFCDDLEYRLQQNGLKNRILKHYPGSLFHEDDICLDYGLFLIDNSLKDQGQSSAKHSIPENYFKWELLLNEINDVVFVP